MRCFGEEIFSDQLVIGRVESDISDYTLTIKVI